MANRRTLNALTKERPVYSDAQIYSSLAESQRIIMTSARKVFRDDNASLRLVETAVKEHEHCIKTLLGMEL